GFFQGTLITRLRLPSFVVTLAGLLGWQGVMIILLGAGGTIPIPDRTINAIANGTLTPRAGWLLTALVVALFAVVTFRLDGRRRRSGLAAPPASLSWLKVGAAAAAGVALMLVTNADRGVGAFQLRGMPYVIPLVFGVLVLWSFV